MNISKYLTALFPKTAPGCSRDRDNLNIYLATVLANRDHKLNFPVDYVGFLRDCLEQKKSTIRDIKHTPKAAPALADKKFAALVDALHCVPTVDIAIAEKIALIADEVRNNNDSVETQQWAGDVRAHFDMSSSFGGKGRILAAIIRYMGSRDCLELGTAYGMSALFILEALAKQGEHARLTTVEGSELQHALSSALLKQLYGDKVSCVYGWTSRILAELVASVGQVDFMFHDAGHSRLDYTRDFNAVLPVLAPGAVVLIDDIRWSDPRFFKGDPQCYQGWRDIADHSRVGRAVEIDDSMGLLLITD
jgi:predicted O-methyltransferase YrrM